MSDTGSVTQLLAKARAEVGSIMRSKRKETAEKEEARRTARPEKKQEKREMEKPDKLQESKKKRKRARSADESEEEGITATGSEVVPYNKETARKAKKR